MNAIPRHVELTLEIRALQDETRAEFAEVAQALGQRIAEKRNAGFAMQRTYDQPAVPCDAGLVTALETAARQGCPTAPRLPSGATHDASAMADLCPISMLFLRCKDGVSHKPEEFASDADMAAAIEAVSTFLTSLPTGA